MIMPVFNEFKTLEIALTGLIDVCESLNREYEIIIIESNSTDGTREFLKSLETTNKVKIIYQSKALGKGFAVRSGMEIMSGDVFMIFDGDLEYTPRDIPKLLIPIENGLSSFVIGSRHKLGLPMRDFPENEFKSKIMNLAHIFFTFLINLFFRVSLSDPFSMYKVIRKEVFSDIRLTSDRFDFDWELICLGIRSGANIIEIPISYNSRGFDEGKKIRFFLDPLTWILALFRFRFLPLKK